MKINILVYLVLIYCSVDAMELRSRKTLSNPTCLGCIKTKKDMQELVVIEKKLFKPNELTHEEEARLFKQRVFSEMNQKTPISTLIVGSVAICCSGLFMLYNNYRENAK